MDQFKLSEAWPELRSAWYRVRYGRTEPMQYRRLLFEHLTDLASPAELQGKRCLEIGPKDGADTRRLSSLGLREIVLLDLPEKAEGILRWINDVSTPTRFIQANLLYMEPVARRALLGKFDLIWCTGVLYHNAEQMKFLRHLHNLLELGGILVLESATLRGPSWRRKGNFVQVHFPQTYRNTGTITHLPSRGAIKAWLSMVGFDEIHDSGCYRRHEQNLATQRYACLCRRRAMDSGALYYDRSGVNEQYVLGEST